MWIISKTFTFEAAHKLPHHDGKCQKLHGHSWKGTIFVSSSKLIQEGAKQGMVMDYKDLKQSFKFLLENKLDHCYLNESLDMENPTSENIAKWLYEQLENSIELVGVLINETCTSSCFFTKRNDINLSSVLGGFSPE